MKPCGGHLIAAARSVLCWVPHSPCRMKTSPTGWLPNAKPTRFVRSESLCHENRSSPRIPDPHDPGTKSSFGYRPRRDLRRSDKGAQPSRQAQLGAVSGGFPFSAFQRGCERCCVFKVTNCDLEKGPKHIKYLPYAFTEHGALMAANVLNSPEAVKMSVHVVRAFIKQRELLTGQAEILKKLAPMGCGASAFRPGGGKCGRAPGFARTEGEQRGTCAPRRTGRIRGAERPAARMRNP